MDTRGVILPTGAPNCFAQARVACELTHKLFRRAKKINQSRPKAESIVLPFYF